MSPDRCARPLSINRGPNASCAQWARTTLPDVDAIAVAFHGGPLDALLAAGSDADLLVVGHSTHVRPGRVLRGRLADDLIVLSPCPVAVIPATTDR